MKHREVPSFWVKRVLAKVIRVKVSRGKLRRNFHSQRTLSELFGTFTLTQKQINWH